MTPDIIATAKGMTSGYTTLAATIAREEIWAAIEKTGVPFLAGHTMDLNPVSCAGALEVVRTVESAGMTDRYAFNLFEKRFLPLPWMIV